MPTALQCKRWIETVKVCPEVDVVVMMANLQELSDPILPILFCSFHRQFPAITERSITFKLLIGIIVRLENSFAGPSRLN